MPVRHQIVIRRRATADVRGVECADNQMIAQTTSDGCRATDIGPLHAR